jgi:exopolysaccharide biosynthesis polyprenyl glycosylphosphotransferase
MLVEQSSSTTSGTMLDRTATAICPVIRDTDIAGWYRHGTTLGVLFLELGLANAPFAVDAIRTKVQRVLETRLTSAERAQILTSFNVFPMDKKDVAEGENAPAVFYPDLTEHDSASRASCMTKRAMDLLGSIAALVALGPVLLAIAIAVKRSSPGPVLFRQTRLGRFGVPFTFLKFRTMNCGNDPSIHVQYVTRFIAGGVDSDQPAGQQKAVYKITDDPRVTRVGRFLRKTSLDELPQLLNVLRGEMSLVGPRPPVPYEFEAYDIWHRRRVMEVKPGITGLWQINGRSRLRFDDMVRLDLRYASSWSLWLDIKILLRTPQAVLFGEGAY